MKNIKIILLIFVLIISIFSFIKINKGGNENQKSQVFEAFNIFGEKLKDKKQCNPRISKCGVIKIIKNTIPDMYDDFTFYHNIPGYPQSFILDDDSTLNNPSNLSNSIYFFTPSNGVFVISELFNPNFQNNITCNNLNTGTVQNVIGNSVVINMQNANTVSCVFENKANEDVITGNFCTPDSWSQIADLPVSKSQAVSFSLLGRIYVGLGTDGSGNYSNDLWEYNPSTDTWTQKADFPGLSRIGGASFSLNNKGYVFAGTDGASNFRDLWEYDPIFDVWTQKANIPVLTGRVGPAGFSLNGKLYVGTGFNGSILLSDFWQYDPTADTWTQKANFPGGIKKDGIGLSINNKGYLGMGRGSVIGNEQSDFWQYDPSTDTWTQKADFPANLRSGQVAFSLNNKGYVGAGSYTGGGFPVFFQDFWQYDPATDTWTQKTDFPSLPRTGSAGDIANSVGYLGAGHTKVPNIGVFQDFWRYCPEI